MRLTSGGTDCVIRTLFNIDINDLDILIWLISLVRLHILDGMHRLQARKDTPKNRVLLVEPRRRIRGNEELGSVRVLSCVCHAHGVRPGKKGMSNMKLKRQPPTRLAIASHIPIMLQLVRELVFKFAVPDARPARAVAERVARLDHELGDHAVEEHAVVVPAPRMADEVLHRLGRLLREQPHVHVAQRRVDRSGRRERCRMRRSGRRGGGDRLFLARRALVEYVSVAGF